MRISAYGLTGDVAGTVRTRAAPNEGTVASGDLEIDDGVYRAYGKELEVERGRLLFTGGAITDRARPSRDARAAWLQGRRDRARTAAQAADHAVLGAEPAAEPDRLDADRRPHQHPGGWRRIHGVEPGGTGRRPARGPARQVRRLDAVGLARDQATSDQSLGSATPSAATIRQLRHLTHRGNQHAAQASLYDWGSVDRPRSPAARRVDVEYRFED